MELIEFITGDSKEARELRECFVWKLIPMLNPDGVINGNYRCSLAGVDLNRKWDNPSKQWHPTIYATKELIRIVRSEKEAGCTLYRSARPQQEKNVFIYSCCPTESSAHLRPNNWRSLFEEKHEEMKSDESVSLKHNEEMKVNSRLLAFIMSKVQCDADATAMEREPVNFSYKDSRFVVTKSKRSTARVVVWSQLGIANSCTVEASFCGNGDNKLDSRLKKAVVREQNTRGEEATSHLSKHEENDGVTETSKIYDAVALSHSVLSSQDPF